jgi:hypothetical protein
MGARAPRRVEIFHIRQWSRGVISQTELDNILAPAFAELDTAALALASAPHWRVRLFVENVRDNTRSAIKAQIPTLDDETVARIVDRVVERIKERVDNWCKIVEAGGTA